MPDRPSLRRARVPLPGAAVRCQTGRMMDLPRRVADRAIVWYQHTLSPRKGWTCAHLVAHGGQSCSAAVRSILAERGVLRGAPAVIRRFAACSQAAMAMPVGVQGVCCCGPIPIPFRF